MKRLIVGSALFAGALALAPTSGCTDDSTVTIPVKPAPARDESALVTELTADATAFAVTNGDYVDDEEDAPHYAVAWLARHGGVPEAVKARSLALLADPGDPIRLEKIEAAQGLVELLIAHDESVRAPLDAYVDRVDAAIHATGDYANTDFEPDAGPDAGAPTPGEVIDDEAARIGPTALTAMIATLEADLTLFAGEDRRDRALAIDAGIRAVALTDLSSATGQARAYAFAPDIAGIYETPNIAMLVEKARLYRLTKDLTFQLEARAVYAALQTLKLSSTPATYSSPSAQAALATDSRNLTLLSSQADIAFALMLMFEITGEERFIDEADSAIDMLATLRGPWCSLTTPQCGTGEVHHILDGALAKTLCAGCTFRVLHALDYRADLALR